MSVGRCFSSLCFTSWKITLTTSGVLSSERKSSMIRIGMKDLRSFFQVSASETRNVTRKSNSIRLHSVRLGMKGGHVFPHRWPGTHASVAVLSRHMHLCLRGGAFPFIDCDECGKASLFHSCLVRFNVRFEKNRNLFYTGLGDGRRSASNPVLCKFQVRAQLITSQYPLLSEPLLASRSSC